MRSARKNIHATDARCTVHVGIADFGLVGHLPCTAITAQLHTHFVDLSESRRANGFAIGEAATIGIDGQSSADFSHPVGQPFFLLAMVAEAVFGHVHDFRAHFGVLKLGDIDILWPHSCQFERRLRSGNRR